MDLKTRIFSRSLALWVLIVVGLCTALCLFALRQNDENEKQVAKSILFTFAERCAPYIRDNNHAEVERLLLEIVGRSHMVVYGWTSCEGEPILTTLDDTVTDGLRDLDYPKGSAWAMNDVRSSDGQRLFDVATRMGKTNIILHLGMSHSLADQQKRSLIKGIASMGVVAVLLGCFLAWGIAGWATREVSAMTLAARSARVASQAASQGKTQFLANMSHEIRTPLNGIVGMTELMLDMALAPKVRKYVVLAKRSADDLVNIISSVLDYTMMEVDKLELVPRRFDLDDCLGYAISALGDKMEEKGIEIMYYIDRDVPLSLVGDDAKLGQAVLNVLGNSIKFSDHGEIGVRVAKDGEVNGKVRLHFSFTDTGEGVPAEKVEAIFKAFAQGDSSATRKYGGMGLGLTVSSKLVEMMGGRMWVESEVGTGSTFHFTATFEVSTEQEAKRIPAEMDSLNGMPVLVVDDNEISRYILREMLTNWQMKPVVVDSGPAALKVLASAKGNGGGFPLVLVDYQMPMMDGFELSKRIMLDQAGNKDTKIIMLTSAARYGDEARCREIGITAHLSKPVKQSALLEAILNALATAPAVKREVSVAVKVSGTRVLLAEDNPVNQAVVSRMLEKVGHSVTLASNGREVMDRWQREQYDVVLMDVQMPEMDGLEAATLIREKEEQSDRHTPIIAVTAHTIPGYRQKCLDAGMDDYMPKPVDKRELLALIEQYTHPTGTRGDTARNLFDRDELVDRFGEDEELLKRLMALFLKDSSEKMASVRRCVSLGDYQGAADASHGLKGAAGDIASQEVFNAADKLETVAETEDAQAAQAALAELNASMDKLVAVLRRQIG